MMIIMIMVMTMIIMIMKGFMIVMMMMRRRMMVMADIRQASCSLGTSLPIELFPKHHTLVNLQPDLF